MATKQKTKKSHAKSKRGMGRLYKRLNGKEYSATSSVVGSFWLEYRINGIRKRDALCDYSGKPITKLKEAEKERARLLTPLTKMNVKEQLEVLKARIETVGDDIKKAKQEQQPPLELKDMWRTFEETREYHAGERTLNDYHSKVRVF